MWSRYFLIACLAYGFCVLLRFFYVFGVGQEEGNVFNGALMINSPDGYFFAQGARDLLQEPLIERSPRHQMLPKILAALVYFFSFLPFAPSFESLLLYLPGFVGSLVVFPVVFIARPLGLYGALCAGLVSGIGVSYYNRTMFGYFDSDMLILPIALGVVVLLLLAIQKRSIPFACLACALGGFGLEYYSRLYFVFVGMALVLGGFGVFLGEVFWIGLCFGLFLAFSLYGGAGLVESFFGDFAHVAFGICFGLVFWGLWRFFGFFRAYPWGLWRGLFVGLLLALFAWRLGFGVIGSEYVMRGISKLDGFFYRDVIGSIAEARGLDFASLSYRLSGGVWWFVVGSVGILILWFRWWPLLLLSPFLALGLSGYYFGLRYTFYATFLYGLGMACVISSVLDWALGMIKSRAFGIFLGLLGLIVALFPHLVHISLYFPPPFLNAKEARALESLEHKRGDYALAWWDYGYSIWYYAGLNTFVDGGIHSGRDNFPISLALTSQNDQLSYNLARLALHGVGIEQFAKEREITNMPSLLEALSKPLELEPKSEELFLVLPLRMLEILPSVLSFSWMDIYTGEPKRLGYFAFSKKRGLVVEFDGGVVVDVQSGLVSAKSIEQDFLLYGVLDLQKGASKMRLISQQGSLVLVLLEDNRALLCDRMYVESLYFRGLFFGLSSEFFELVQSDDWMRIYRVKQEAR